MDANDRGGEIVSDLGLQAGERWYVVHTLPNREAYALARLAAQGFRSFLPRFTRTVRHARQTRIVDAPVFPRYAFIALNPDRDRWRSVNGTPGVASLIMARNRPSPAPVGVVETLIASIDAQGRLHFTQSLHPGQRVRLVAGPFADALGVLDRLDSRGRIEVLLNIMGGDIRVTLRGEWVEPAA
ncbi:MAG TPA: transcription termination/antitermination NusG family protein [Methylocystis sp.]|nr:transcription termination/antitermination NusG family protein [Methylocystis sp.]